jgi:Cu+-exporting ATPase
MSEVKEEIHVKCYHCGEQCIETLHLDDKTFCCYGCKTIFEILQENNLCEYYTFDQTPGKQHITIDENFAYLDTDQIRKKLVAFEGEGLTRVKFFTPSIHCASCIWLLEHLEKLHTAILKSEVNFSQKTVTIDFRNDQIKLSEVASILNKIGYAPTVTLDNSQGRVNQIDKSLVVKLAIAGFSFGNVMLFSFPEYLGLDQQDASLMRLFAWLNLLLSVPVFFFSAKDYFKSALSSFQQKMINIDVPIALGLLALFTRSTYDILTATGPGYLDSFTGLVFFLLIGRWFQNKTYESLAFDRDFKSYFPLAVYTWTKQEWQPTIIYELKEGDQIRLRNMEIIPADSYLLDERAFIDYSFVTGESKPTQIKKGDLVYAGGRVIGTPIVLAIHKKTSQSHLTSLWNHDAFQKVYESKYKKIIDRAARNFTWIVLTLALITAIVWYSYQPTQMWLVITSVLMVACPCALALAAPFTYGNMMRFMGERKLYLKNADVVERMATIDTVVFDKTGTITHGDTSTIQLRGLLTEEEISWVKTLAGNSTHPLSQRIFDFLKTYPNHPFQDYKETAGAGLSATFYNHKVSIGSANHVKFNGKTIIQGSTVYIAIDDEVKGHFKIITPIREEIKPMLKRLKHVELTLLSGDDDHQRDVMQKLFPQGTTLKFNQSPHDKLAYIRQLQAEGKKVMMIGDGLNDAGALKQSDVGIAITDNTSVFTPACDAILQGSELKYLDQFLVLAKSSTSVLKTAFTVSFCYNGIALMFAATGHLTPLVAAILMPISSISVVSVATFGIRILGKQKMKRN